MIKDIEEESKTKFSMGVEFTFLLKGVMSACNFRIASLYKTRYNNYNIVLWIRC